MRIYHNPRCQKSRETLEIIKKSGKVPEVIEYLKNPPSKKELEDLLKMLGIKAESLVRKGESIFKDKFKGKNLSEKEWVAAMVANPVLIERPIVVKSGQAIIGRPPESVKKLL